MNLPNNKIEELLAKQGERLREGSAESRDRVWSKVSVDLDQAPAPKYFKYLVPVGVGVLAVLLVAVMLPQGGSSPFEIAGNVSSTKMADSIAAPTAELEMGDMVALSAASGMVSSPPTFTRKFMQNLGRNKAQADEIAAAQEVYGYAFDTDASIRMMMRRGEYTDVQNSLIAFGAQIDGVESRNGTDWMFAGRIASDQYPALRSALQDMVADKYFLETQTSSSRLTDLIAIDDKIEEVEERIAELKAELPTANEERRAEIERDIATYEGYLRERNGIKEDIQVQTNYTDFTISVRTVQSWIQTTSYYRLKETIIGFEPMTYPQQIQINLLHGFKAVIKVLSYLVWFIPIVLLIWYWRRKRK